MDARPRAARGRTLSDERRRGDQGAQRSHACEPDSRDGDVSARTGAALRLRRRKGIAQGCPTMKFSRSWAIALWVAAALVCDAAHAQSFPNRPITVIMPFAGGSASDVVSRVLFNKMATILGQPIVVENKPGAGGNLGTALAAMAAPDGY